MLQPVYCMNLMCSNRPQDPPSWHPAAPEVKAAAIQSKEFCAENGTDLARIAINHFVK